MANYETRRGIAKGEKRYTLTLDPDTRNLQNYCFQTWLRRGCQNGNRRRSRTRVGTEGRLSTQGNAILFTLGA